MEDVFPMPGRSFGLFLYAPFRVDHVCVDAHLIIYHSCEQRSTVQSSYAGEQTPNNLQLLTTGAATKSFELT
jgi:hypothetical protein